MHTYDTLCAIACTAAREAGRIINTHAHVAAFDTKTDGSPVTVADYESHQTLLAHLSKTGIAILSEESPDIFFPESTDTHPHTAHGTFLNTSEEPPAYPSPLWIIDPLDGTRDFIQKTGDFVVMVGLLEAGRPVIGVVYAPVHDVLYYAVRGQGAWMVHQETKTRLTVSTRTHDLRFVRSVHHATDEMHAVATTLGATFHPRGSMGIKAGMVCEGVGDFFYTRGNLGEWDVCAPEIITLEAGGTVTDCTGSLLQYGTHDHHIEHGVLFSNRVCHEQVLCALTQK